MDILNTLQALNACHGPSGDEHGVAETIRALAAPHADEHWFDSMGNLIAVSYTHLTLPTTLTV